MDKNVPKVPMRVDKPWGYELIWARTADYVGKVLHINREQRLSLQYHELKEETIYVTSGQILFAIEDGGGELREIILNPGDVQHVRPRKRHRMTALAESDVFEVSTPHLDDVVRLEDSYGRAGAA